MAGGVQRKGCRHFTNWSVDKSMENYHLVIPNALSKHLEQLQLTAECPSNYHERLVELLEKGCSALSAGM